LVIVRAPKTLFLFQLVISCSDEKWAFLLHCDENAVV